MEDNFNVLFARLAKSKFRSSFKLKPADIEYINKKGLQAIEQHTRDFVLKRLAPAEPKNDGRQTPIRGHPVFIAQHATATCCRSCLAKWHKIASHESLNKTKIDYIVLVLIVWIKNQIDVCRPIV